MTALRPPGESKAHWHWLKASDGHLFVALWQTDAWWTCGREPAFEEDHLIAQGVTYSHPCLPNAVVSDPSDSALADPWRLDLTTVPIGSGWMVALLPDGNVMATVMLQSGKTFEAIADGPAAALAAAVERCGS